MCAKMDRRSAALRLVSLPALVVSAVSGCGDSDQFKNGAMVKPSDVIERRADRRAQKQEETEKANQAKKTTKKP